MFVKLTDFKRKRTNKEAFGFYLAYLVLIVIVGLIAETLFGTLTGSGLDPRRIVAVAGCLYLAYVVVSAKKRTQDFTFILLGLVAGFLAAMGGGALLGLVPVAYLTTK